jgi:hypothetical protein
MLPKNIPVVTVKSGGATGTPEDFEARYDRLRKKGSGRIQRSTPSPKLRPLENKSMDQRLSEHGIEEV